MRSAATTPAGTPQARQLLSFTLGQEEYGIDILKVQELLGYNTMTVTRLANTPDYVKGVVNLRGAIVTIVDMRIKFDLGPPTYDAFTVAIILNIANHIVGLVVDSVSDVLTLQPEQIKPVPPTHASMNTGYLTGLGTLDERMLILVDLEKLMTSADMGILQAASA